MAKLSLRALRAGAAVEAPAAAETPTDTEPTIRMGEDGRLTVEPASFAVPAPLSPGVRAEPLASYRARQDAGRPDPGGVSTTAPAPTSSPRLSLRRLRGQGGMSGGGATGATPPIPTAALASHDVASPEVTRALRLGNMLANQGKAIGDFNAADAFAEGIRRDDASHPMLPTIDDQLERMRKYAGGMLTPGQEAALRREQARIGVDRERRAGSFGRSLAESPVRYPLQALGALLRPIDAPLPAAATAAIKGDDPLRAALAGADPLGRFDPQGNRTEAWQNPAPSWHDAFEAALERWGTPVQRPSHVINQRGETVILSHQPPEKELAGLGTTGTAVAGTIADIGLSPSTYVTAAAGRAGQGVRFAGKTVVPGAAVTAAARFPGSALKAGGEAIAARLAEGGRLEAAHTVSRVGRALGKVGPAQALEAAPRAVGAIPVGSGKTVGQLLGESLNRYWAIDQVADPGLRQQLREIAQMRESATATQTGQWADRLEALLKDVPPDQQRRIRDMIESPDAFDWDVRTREPFDLPERGLARVEPRRPDVGPQPPPEPSWDLPRSDEPIRTPDDEAWRARAEDDLRRAQLDYTSANIVYGPDDARTQVARLDAQQRADELAGVPRADEDVVRRLRRAYGVKGDEPVGAAARPRAPEGPPSNPLGPAEPAPTGRPREVFVGRGSDTSGPARMAGQPASPTAVPGTPDAKRYGAIPNHLVDQVPTVTREEGELVARVENALRDARRALQERGLLGEGRENYFPRERTSESLKLERGLEARAEALGRGSNPRLRTRFGFQDRRHEHAWINDLIARVNEQDAAKAARDGLPAPAPIPAVEDTTSAVNTFWRRLPERLRAEFGPEMVPEPERFLDLPKETLQRYFARVTRSVNDADALKKVSGLKDAQGRSVARGFVREGRNGTVFERHEVPVGGEYPTGAPPPEGMADSVRRAPPWAKRIGAGTMGDGGEAIVGPPRRPVAGELPGEVPPGGREAFQGKSPFEPLVSTEERAIPGYVYPKNKAWQEAFPKTALPRDVAAWIDAFGKPYWANEGFAGFIDQVIIRPLHKVQLPWKVAATSGAGPRFALRNYYSQQVMNLQAYGPKAFAPAIQRESHLMALPDRVIEAYPKLMNRPITVGGRTYTVRELREVAKQTGLWRTLPEAEIFNGVSPYSSDFTSPAHASRAMGWRDPRAAISAAMGKLERGASRAAKAVGPANPISKDFAPTKHAFHPLAEYGERQGRMAALMLELESGKPLVEAAQAAAVTHVNYQTFSPAFEKYGTLAYPFAKFGVGMTPNQVKWALQYPGRSMVTERLLRGGERMVPREERERYASEPKSQLLHETGARLVGWPGTGALKEPETEGGAKGPDRLPYVTMPPTADVLLNTLGAPARVLGARDKGSALASEVLENAFPAVKIPYELAAGRNVFTGEPIDLNSTQPAPRAVHALWKENPELARKVFKAVEVTDRRTGQTYLATPQMVNLIWRYYPNVAAADLASAFVGGRRPYDNQTAIALRLLGLTQVMHDPLVPASQEARESAKLAEELKQRVQGWLPP